MTQVFEADGTVRAGDRHQGRALRGRPGEDDAQTDGYEAVQLGLVEGRRRRRTSRPPGHFKKAGVPPTRAAREVTLATPARSAEAGDQVLVRHLRRRGARRRRRHQPRQGLPGRREAPPFRRRRGDPRLDVPPRAGLDRRRRRFRRASYQGMRAAGPHGRRADVTMNNLNVVRVDAENHLIFLRGRRPGSAQHGRQDREEALEEVGGSGADERKRKRPVPKSREDRRVRRAEEGAGSRGERRSPSDRRNLKAENVGERRRCPKRSSACRSRRHLVWESSCKQNRAREHRGTHKTKNRAEVVAAPARSRSSRRAPAAPAGRRTPTPISPRRHGVRPAGRTRYDLKVNAKAKKARPALRALREGARQTGRPPRRRSKLTTTRRRTSRACSRSSASRARPLIVDRAAQREPRPRDRNIPKVAPSDALGSTSTTP